MIILYNAKIYTQDLKTPYVAAMAIERELICAIGSDDDILSRYPNAEIKLNLEGKTILPGLTDSHLHLGLFARQVSSVDCETKTKTECLKRIEEKAKVTPKGDWIIGHGWNQNIWDSEYGTLEDLDNITPEHPVYLTSKSIHAAWANSLAFKIAGITETTPDPEGGAILHHQNGMLSGILLEKAMLLVQKSVPKQSPQQAAEIIHQAQNSLWKLGVTGVHDFDDSVSFSALQMLDANQQLKLRVTKSIPHDKLSEAIGVGLRTGFGSNFLRIGSVKFFADGALGPQTAAMLESYANNPTNTGFLLLDSKTIFHYGIQAVQAGLSMSIHAIGDRANREVLAAYTQLRTYENMNQLPPLRHRVEHVQVLHPSDFSKFSELSIIASVQPIHATSDMDMADRFWGKRSRHAYAFKSLLTNDAITIFGSDAPVESPSPFLGIHAAVTRQRVTAEASEKRGWNPQEKISIDQAIRAYTVYPAYATGLELKSGKLIPNYLADLIVCDNDPYLTSPEKLYSINVEATMVDGNWVWKKDISN